MNDAQPDPPPDVFTDGYTPLLPSPADGFVKSGQERLRAETALYLGLFSLTPLLLVFRLWASLPLTLIVGSALWTAYELRREGVKAFTLTVSAWVMVALSLSFLIASPVFAGTQPPLTPFAEMLSVVALSGLFILPLFALLALQYGVRSRIMTVKQLVGMGAATIHALAWVAGFMVLGITYP